MDEKRIFCLDCSAKSPEVETEYTLISGRFGWRLTRRMARDGSAVLEWRCPTCWAKYKAEKAALPPDSQEPAPISRPPSSRRGPFR